MLRWSAVLLSLAALVPANDAKPPKFDIKRHTSQRVVVSNSPIPQASFVTDLSRKVPRRAVKKQALRELRRAASKTAVVIGTDDDEEYATAVTVGGQQFEVIIDTGRCDCFSYMGFCKQKN